MVNGLIESDERVVSPQLTDCSADRGALHLGLGGCFSQRAITEAPAMLRKRTLGRWPYQILKGSVNKSLAYFSCCCQIQ
jgi:hypothetical protein